MGKYVHQLLRTHPDLEPLRAARVTYSLHCHTDAIWLAAVRQVGGNGWVIKEELRAPEWWKPVKRSRGDQIADKLAGKLKGRWMAKAQRLEIR